MNLYDGIKDFFQNLFEKLQKEDSDNNFSLEDLLVLNPETLSEKEIQKIIFFKMKFFKQNKGLKIEIKKYFQKKHILAIKKFQKRFRGFLIKKSFLKVIEKNKLIQQKKNYHKLRKRIESFDNSVITKKFSFRNSYKYSRVYKSIREFRENNN